VFAWWSVMSVLMLDTQSALKLEMSPVSLMMTSAHVLRLGSMPEPEKVDPLVLPWQ